MSKDFLDERRAGLEEAFFAKHNEMLRQKLHAGGAAQAKRDALSAASGITDPAVLDKLIAAGMSGETLTALSVVPLVSVAWADGTVSPEEKEAVLSGAAQAGLRKGEAGHQMLERWLDQKPGPDLLAAWKDYVRALVPTLGSGGAGTLRTDILGRARSVAEATGGFLGIGASVSPAEKAVLREVEQALS